MFLDLLSGVPYKRSLFNAIVTPRPIGWISSRSSEGRDNLAPFSHFNLVSTAPPVLIFSCNSPTDRPAKDTLANVRATGEFVYNLVSEELCEQMNRTSAPLPPGVDEFEHAKLEKAPCLKVAVPRVARAPANFECKLLRIVEIEPVRAGDTSSHVVFGSIIGVHMDDDLVDDKSRFDTARAKPMARLGGLQYAGLGPVFELPSAFTKV
jgi:flavin reductase (DIM6/NTAB) family NADH-FMN oxidoreductase RutF